MRTGPIGLSCFAVVVRPQLNSRRLPIIRKGHLDNRSVAAVMSGEFPPEIASAGLIRYRTVFWCSTPLPILPG